MITPREAHDSNGFTLIELLVVSAIALSITGFVITSYTSFNRREKLRQAAKTLKTDLRFAQTRASSGVKPLSPVICPTLQGYQVTIANDNSSYNIQALCSNGLQGPITTVTLPTEITLTSTVSPLVFNVLTGTISRNADLTLSTTDLSTGNAASYIIRVYSSGDINDVTGR